MWDALEVGGYKPHGKEHDFRARCPGHGGGNPSALRVSVGADGRVLLYCFAHGCPVEAITGALGLQVRDLFPPGHHRARRLPLLRVKRADFQGAALDVANVLHALERLGMSWQLMLTSNCPACGSPGAWLRASSGAKPDADCPEGCDADRYVQALLARLQKQQA
jgi:hypothetical protein